jgi:hypothetical protein
MVQARVRRLVIRHRAGIEEGDFAPDIVVETNDGKLLCEPNQKDALS